MTPEEADALWQENARLTKENKALVHALEILAAKPFNDCFNYLCQSQNECQAFGCAVQKKINQLKNQDEE